MHYLTAEGDRIVCGQMDAKNSFGGYNGYTTFYVRLNGNTVQVAYFGESSEFKADIGCTEAEAGNVHIAV